MDLQTDWSQHRQSLLEAKAGILNRLERTDEYGLGGAMREQLGELSTVDNHPADIASELFEREKDVGLRDADWIRVQEIDRALAAMAAGSYGICAHCGQLIPTARLEAHPLSTLCIDCKKADEEEHPARQRPIEEEFLHPGFARTDTDKSSSVGFDGEDSWQAVARYNERSGQDDDYEQIFLDDNEGVVDSMDVISNEEYKRQLPT